MQVKLIYAITMLLTIGQITCGTINNDCTYPSFFDSMDAWGSYDKNKALTNHYSSKAKELYQTFWLNNVQVSPQPSIPKIIHQIWLGSPFPEKYKKLQQTWKENNPDWVYMLWTEKEIAEFGLLNKELFDKATNYGQKSDIARYEILFRFGGLYVDVDFECLKSFDILHHSNLDFYTSCLPEKDGSLTLLNGLFAARAGHPILKACIDRLKGATLNANYDAYAIMASTGPYFFTRCVYDNLSLPGLKCVIFPVTFFYPLPNSLKSRNMSLREATEGFVKNESFTVHWWHCSWQKG